MSRPDTVPAIVHPYPRRARSRRLLAAAIVLLAAACGDDDDTAASEGTATTAGDDDEFCAPMEELANFNAESPPVDPSGEWATVQEEVVSRGNGAMGLYDDVIAVAPAEIEGQLQTLRDYSQEVIDAAEQATSAEDFAAVLGTPPQAVLAAAQDVDTYITEACGFGLTSGG